MPDAWETAWPDRHEPREVPHASDPVLCAARCGDAASWVSGGALCRSMEPLFAVLLGLGCLLCRTALRTELHVLLARNDGEEAF